VTVLAPTGMIGLVMDCDTTGIEPDFALVKFKKLAGGGYFKIVNGSVDMALRRLGYTRDQILAIEQFAKGTGSLEGAPHVNRATLRARGFDDAALGKIEAALAGAFELSFAFNRFVLGDEFCKGVLGLDEAQLGRSKALRSYATSICPYSIARRRAESTVPASSGRSDTST
jgi:ribonucleoside-diphosphate reductase alpha chain